MENKGCIISPKDSRDYIIKGNKLFGLPSTFLVKNWDQLAIKNQELVSSCVAHATSTVLEYYIIKEYGLDTYKQLMNYNTALLGIKSPAGALGTQFIYGGRRQLALDSGKAFTSNYPGMTLLEACKIVTKYGDMLYEDCPGNLEIPDCYAKAEEAYNNSKKKTTAYKYRLKEYYRCESSNDIKVALMNYGPVLGAVMWTDDYSVDKDGLVTFNRNSEEGGHAIVILGWNKKGWICQNSWGINWGNNGRMIIPFKDASGDTIVESRCLIDFVMSESTQSLTDQQMKNMKG